MAEITYQSAVEQIKNSLDIVDVISRHVVLKKSGHNFMGLCPFHNEKTPSFTVTPSRQIFKCFGCGEGGDVFAFLMKYHNQNFTEVVREQAEALGIELPSSFDGKKSEQNKKEKDILLKAMNSAMKFYHNNLLDNKGALEYLEKRGVGEVAVSKFRLGLAPNSMKALADALKKDFTNEELFKAGLVYEKNSNGAAKANAAGGDSNYYDRFRNRLIIPIFDISDAPIAFGARAIVDGQNPKYLNSPDSTIYNKSSVLYGLNSAKDAIKEEDAVIIMEGYFDVIAAQVNGVKNVVASCGTALTPQHIKLLSRFTQSRRIYLAFDSDSAGTKATQAGGEVIKQIFQNLGDIKQYDSSFSHVSNSVCEIRVVSQIGGKDPDEFIQEFGAEEYKAQVAKAPLFLDYQLDLIYKQAPETPTPQEKSALVVQIAEILKEIKNSVILADYIKDAAFKLKVEENILKRHVQNIQNAQNRKEYHYESEENVTNYEDEIRAKGEIKGINSTAEARHKAMEANLVKLALAANTPEKKTYYEQLIKTYEPRDELNAKIIHTIDKSLCGVNNVSELAKKIFLEFCSDRIVQKEITDLMYSASEFERMKYEDYVQALHETFDRLNNIKKEIIKEEIRSKYKNSQISEEEKIEISREIYEKVSEWNKNLSF